MKILIVDDSPTETALLKSIFAAEKDMEVVGCATNGKEAVDMTAALKPDLITMDIHMPVMNGFEATRLIMSQHPTPIVVISSYLDDKALKASFFSLEAGALMVMDKPINIKSPDFSITKKYLVDMLRSMAEIKVIKRRYVTQTAKKHYQYISSMDAINNTCEIIAIGASVGGPQALKMILAELPADFPVPIVVVQHMTDGFINGFTKWLTDSIPLTVKSVEDSEILIGGHVYFAPDHTHFTVVREQGCLQARLLTGAPVTGFCPSATVLLNSVANVCSKNAIGILLTGMGSDGALGLLEIKKNKGHTLIQDEKSAIVFGMAGVALSLGAVDKTVELDQIAHYLKKMTLKQNEGK